MRIVDTSAWIEWISYPSTLANALERHLPQQHDWLVPTIVQLELTKWLIRERRTHELSHIISFTHYCNIAPLHSEIAINAAKACHAHNLATADAIVFATARAYDADLLTCDRDFEDLPGVIYVPKA